MFRSNNVAKMLELVCCQFMTIKLENMFLMHRTPCSDAIQEILACYMRHILTMIPHIHRHHPPYLHIPSYLSSQLTIIMINMLQDVQVFLKMNLIMIAFYYNSNMYVSCYLITLCKQSSSSYHNYRATISKTQKCILLC